MHRKADELLADPNIERLFLGGAHQAATPATTGAATAAGIL
jgi:branched-chain amino acid transport system ATP-binding protein